MDVKLKRVKPHRKNEGKRYTRMNTRERDCSGWVVHHATMASSKAMPIEAELLVVQNERSIQAVYRHLYDQEEKDIARAVEFLAKFAL